VKQPEHAAARVVSGGVVISADEAGARGLAEARPFPEVGHVLFGKLVASKRLNMDHQNVGLDPGSQSACLELIQQLGFGFAVSGYESGDTLLLE
jgi:hypothetical protein